MGFVLVLELMGGIGRIRVGIGMGVALRMTLGNHTAVQRRRVHAAPSRSRAAASPALPIECRGG